MEEPVVPETFGSGTRVHSADYEGSLGKKLFCQGVKLFVAETVND